MKKFRDFSLRKKLIITYLVITLIPMILFFCYNYFYLGKKFSKKINYIFETTNKQMLQNVDNLLERLVNLSKYVNVDKDLNRILNEYDNGTTFNKIESFDNREKINSYLYKGIMFMDDIVDSVVVYSNKADEFFYKTKTGYLNPSYDLDKIKKEEWYNRALEANGVGIIIGINKDTMFLSDTLVFSIAKSIVNPKTLKTIGVLKINVNINNIQSVFNIDTINEKSKVVLLDEKNQILYSNFDNLTGKDIKNIKDEKWDEVDILKSKNYISNLNISEKSGWKILYLISRNDLLSEVNSINNITFVLMLFILFLVIVIAKYIAKSITNPIVKLCDTMEKFSGGDLTIKSPEFYGEIGLLSKKFNSMSIEIQTLINRIYEKEKEKRRLEFEALQSQINPHFLYNTLNSFKWIANMQGYKSMVSMLDDLVELLIFAAKCKSDKISINDEIIQLKHYVNILDIRFLGSCEVFYDISEEVKEYTTLKFLLQPILENAVFHGLKNKAIDGFINIRIEKKDSFIIYEVTDNGEGIKGEEIDKILMEPAKNNNKVFNKIGLYNVNKRIKLIFGDEYGISIKSKEKEFTTILVKIPAIKYY